MLNNKDVCTQNPYYFKAWSIKMIGLIMKVKLSYELLVEKSYKPLIVFSILIGLDLISILMTGIAS